MANELATYLNDHNAGARFAVDMLQRLRDTHTDPALKQAAARLLKEIEEDRTVLQQLTEKIGSQNVFKEASAWLAEKASRLKLRLGPEDNFAVFEALEVLSLGVLGKLKLWKSLVVISKNDTRLSGLNFDELIERAQSQHDELEALRLRAAETLHTAGD